MKRIFKTLLLVAAITVMAAPAKAYAGDGLLQFGIKAGMNFSNMSDMKDFDISGDFLKSYTGFNAGVLLKVNLPLGFEIQPELLYYQSGFSMHEELTDFRLNYVEGSLRVPVNIQWGIKIWEIKPYVMLSPFVGYALHQGFNSNNETFNDLLDLDMDTETLNKFNYGIGIGVGINVWKFQVGFKWNWNLNKISQDVSDIDSKFNGGELHLAFIF